MKKLLALLLSLSILSGCPSQRDDKTALPEKSEQEVELTQVDFEELEGWNQDNQDDFVAVFAENCNRIGQLKMPYLYASLIKISTADFQNICQDFFDRRITTGKELKAFIKANFTPYLIQTDGNAEGKFTSYYESEIFASRKRYGKYVYPIYGKPSDLIEINLKDFDPELPNKRLVGRINNQKMQPYYTRAEIENTDFDAPVLLWADSLIDIHIMQIQGSAVAHLDDGSNVRIGYADSNGRRFKGIGSILLEQGLINPSQADMINIKKWLKENPNKAKTLMQKNERFIFHRIVDATGPIGAFGIPLTAGRSLAVDRHYIPLGSLLWLVTSTPTKEPLQKLVAAQDIGSAIKGAVRGDYFWGSGGDEILASAGKMNNSGHYYILVPKEKSYDVK